MYRACAIFHSYFYFIFYFPIFYNNIFLFSPRFDAYDIFNAYVVTYENFIINFMVRWKV